MGQCGCGDFYPEFTLPGPDGSLYAIELFSGCHDCHAPAGVHIAKLSGEQIGEWEAEYIPKLELHPLNPVMDKEVEKGYRDRFLTLVDVDALAKYIGFEGDKIEVYRGLAEARVRTPGEPAGRTTRRVVHGEIREERKRQDDKWGGTEHDDEHSVSDFIAYVTKQAGEAVDRHRNIQRRQMIRVAATALALIEKLDREEKREESATSSEP